LIESLRNTAAKIFAASLYKLFPNSVLKDYRVNNIGFYYDFSFPYPDNSALLDLLEGQMRKYVKEEFEIKSFEMLAQNAKEYFDYLKLDKSKIENKEGLLSFFQMDGFIDVAKGILLENSKYLKFFKIFKLEKIEKDTFRVYAVVSEDKNSLKKQINITEDYKNNSHLVLGEKFLFFKKEDNKIFYYPAGYLFRENLKEFFISRLKFSGFRFVDSPSKDKLKWPLDLYKEKNLNKLAQIDHRNFENYDFSLFTYDRSSSDILYIFCKEKEISHEVNSFLIFIDEIFNILRLSYNITLKIPKIKGFQKYTEIFKIALKNRKILFEVEKQKKNIDKIEVEWNVKDGIGRFWKSAFLTMKKENNLAILQGSSFFSLERIAALVLEGNKGELPFFLYPYYLKILVQNDDCLEYANKIESLMENENIRVNLEVNADIRKGVREAIIENIPYVAVIGEKEKQGSYLSFRKMTDKTVKKIKVDEFTSLIKSKVRSGFESK